MPFFWKVTSVIYHQRLFFKENSMVAVVGTDLCLFWKVTSVIYHLRLFLRGNKWWLLQELEGDKCYILS